ncbi:MAG: hypothetical protein ACI93R_003945 [Flavobacteriales bacterium]|jgi:hypothetical protein
MVDHQIFDKLKKIKKHLEDTGQKIDFSEEDNKILEEHEGPDFGPRNDIEVQETLKEIRSLDDDE